MDTNTLETQLEVYANDLKVFRAELGAVAEPLFKLPDHIAIKAADKADFESLIEKYKPLSSDSEINIERINDRLLASALLKVGLSLPGFGRINWLEIMEPRPDMVGRDKVGLDHVEFYQPTLKATGVILKAAGVEFKPRQNANHEWLEVNFGSSDEHEVKFTNTQLAGMVSGGGKQQMSAAS